MNVEFFNKSSKTKTRLEIKKRNDYTFRDIIVILCFRGYI